jgi:hypothetical protein
MKVRKIAIGAAAATAVLGAVVVGATSAHASVGPVQYTPADNANSISGYYAHAINDGINFSHETSYAGGDGQHTIEQLPAWDGVQGHAIGGAAGIALCNQQTGQAAQIGLVNVGGGRVDVVDATGYFTNGGNNGDECQGGIVNPGGLTATSHAPVPESLPFSTTANSTVLHTLGTIPAAGTKVKAEILALPGLGYSDGATYYVEHAAGLGNFALALSPGGTPVKALLAETGDAFITWTTPGSVGDYGYSFNVLVKGIPDNNTVSLDILYDAQHAYSFKGHSHSAGTITFAATNLGAPGVSYQGSVTAPHGTEFNEADTGVVADTKSAIPLSGTPPFPNPGVNGNLNADPNLLEGFSHVTLAGNPANGGAVVEGSLQANSAWTAFPVASSASGKVYLGPTVFVEDHFLELVGAPVS